MSFAVPPNTTASTTGDEAIVTAGAWNQVSPTEAFVLFDLSTASFDGHLDVNDFSILSIDGNAITSEFRPRSSGVYSVQLSCGMPTGSTTAPNVLEVLYDDDQLQGNQFIVATTTCPYDGVANCVTHVKMDTYKTSALYIYGKWGASPMSFTLPNFYLRIYKLQ